MLIHGSIGRGLTVVYLTAAGYGASRTGVLPAWFGRFAYVIAAINLAFVPLLFFGTDAARFYSAIGWGNSAVNGWPHWHLGRGRRHCAAASASRKGCVTAPRSRRRSGCC